MDDQQGSASLDDVMRTFAAAILAKVNALGSLNFDPRWRARLLESITGDIRKCTDCVAPHASTAALAEAERLGVNLWESGWHDIEPEALTRSR